MKKLAYLFGLPVLAAMSLLAQSAPILSSESYIWRNVVIGGGGFVTGIIFHPRQKDLMYARTDIGGAYRWEAASKRWIPITDWIGTADANLMGIESIALDPSNPNRVYLAAGTYTQAEAAILRSDDMGRTFKRTAVPFKMGGNEMGRFNGERLAVDPNNGGILFFGSRQDGLWKSVDQGVTWQRVEGFPNVELEQPSTQSSRRRYRGFGRQQVGIVCVLFDPSSGALGQPTPTLYAAVSATTTNLYRSTNGGVFWQAVTNQPVGLRPNHLVIAPDGIMYLSYGKQPGPNTMTDGAVWKLNPKDGVWTNITPVKSPDGDQPFGYGAVAVDARHPSTIMVTTFCRWQPQDEVFRSTNGGISWNSLLQKAQWDLSSAPYTKRGKPHWMGDIEINPFDPDHVLFTTGYGIWGCSNATDADAGQATRWAFLNDGLEETVPLALISPPEGAHLFSGLGDIDGFRHDDLTVSPPQGAFKNPSYSNTEDMTIAGKKPNVIVRTGSSENGIVRAAISRDGGGTWEALNSEPPNSEGAGTIAVSADGKTVVWTPRRSAPHYSADLGRKWTACVGLRLGMRVVADTMNPTRFYTFDSHAGRVLISTNEAATFVMTEAALPAAEDFRRGFGGDAATLTTTPGVEGDLWLAFGTNGLYHSKDGGRHFAKLERVQQADALGFGRAATGKSFPVLFLVGKADMLHAIFRSDDVGKTWVRINDDHHQFGSISRVTGDPRIYGRIYLATGGRGVIYGERTSDRR